MRDACGRLAMRERSGQILRSGGRNPFRAREELLSFGTDVIQFLKDPFGGKHPI